MEKKRTRSHETDRDLDNDHMSFMEALSSVRHLLYISTGKKYLLAKPKCQKGGLLGFTLKRSKSIKKQIKTIRLRKNLRLKNIKEK